MDNSKAGFPERKAETTNSDRHFEVSLDPSAFRTPLFSDPDILGLKRVAVVDVGSNSVRLVVFDGAARSPAYFYNEKVLCGLGASLVRTGKLDPEGKKRALAAIKRFAFLVKGMNASALLTVGTAAVREASDGAAFCAEIEKETGLRIDVASGEEEARLSAQGVLLGWPKADGLICDIGGSSLEVAELRAGKVGRRATSPLGPLAINRYRTPESRKERIDIEVARLRSKLDASYGKLFLVGGSWRVIAKLDMERRNHPLRVINEYQLTTESACATIDWIERDEPGRLRLLAQTSVDRMKLIPAAGSVLRSFLEQFQPKNISISAYGIREGMLYDRMPERLRLRDPLIEACLYAEQTSARLPGYGDLLFGLIGPLFKKETAEMLRLVRAACLLHDVTWRAHPDYRAEICFDNATRANLGGLNHAGRVFLALALYHRYRNAGGSPEIRSVSSLLDRREAATARILGKAMRFGAMFTVVSPEKIVRLKFKPKKHVLILSLPDSMKDIYGEVVEARFRSLALAMNCEAMVQIV